MLKKKNKNEFLDDLFKDQLQPVLAF